MIKSLLFLLCSLASLAAMASGFEVDGIEYVETEDGCCKVVRLEDESLTDIIIPASVTCGGTTYTVTGVGESAFWGYSDQLVSVTLPNTITTIGGSAFALCSNLTSINIPSSVTTIGESAFAGCSSLISIAIPNSVTTIGEQAFGGCAALKSIVIPCSVTEMGKDAFYGCHGLESLTISNSDINYYDVFSDCNNIKELTYAEGCEKAVRIIGTGSNLTSVILSNTVKSIDDYTFNGCQSLLEITIPNSVTKIGEGAFSGCTGLTSIELSDSIDTIGCNAFADTGLTSITIPKSVSSVGENAFDNCESLTSLIYADGCTKAISVGAQNVTNVTLPNSITTICDSAFYYYSKLMSINLPDGMTSIGEFAFYWCSKLASVDFPEGLTSIGENAFYRCEELATAEIPNTVNFIGENAFYNCSKLASVNIPNSLTKINAGTFGSCHSLKSVDIPNSVVYIGDNAFNACDDLKDISIPASVAYVGNDAFADTKWLVLQMLKDNNIYINNMLYKCKAGQKVIDINEGTTVICSGAFSEYSFRSSELKVNIPASVTSIGDYAFANCKGLKSLIIPKSVGAIGEGAFFQTGLTTVEIPSTVTHIGEGAFTLCKSLTSVTIPESVAEIGNSAFAQCDNLKSVSVNWQEPLDFSYIDSWYVNVFPILDDCYLYVPTGTAALYSAADVWKNFVNIVESDEPLGIENAESGDCSAEVARYDIHGQRISAPQAGINIIKYINGKTKKVLVK